MIPTILHFDYYFREETDGFVFDIYVQKFDHYLYSSNNGLNGFLIDFKKIYQKDGRLDGIILNPCFSFLSRKTKKQYDLNNYKQKLFGFEFIKNQIRNKNKTSRFNDYFSQVPVLFQGDYTYEQLQDKSDLNWIFEEGLTNLLDNQKPSLNSYIDANQSNREVALESWLNYITNPKKH